MPTEEQWAVPVPSSAQQDGHSWGQQGGRDVRDIIPGALLWVVVAQGSSKSGDRRILECLYWCGVPLPGFCALQICSLGPWLGTGVK